MSVCAGMIFKEKNHTQTEVVFFYKVFSIVHWLSTAKAAKPVL
jgi:hypothetical protein